MDLDRFGAGIATDGAGSTFITESSPPKTSVLLAACADATSTGIAAHDPLLTRFGQDGACVWSRWLSKDPSAPPGDDGPHRIAALPGMVAVRMSNSLVGTSDDGTVAWTMPFDFSPSVLAAGSDFVVFTLTPPQHPDTIVLQHLSTAGVLGVPITFSFASAAAIAGVDVAAGPDGSVVIHGNTDVAIPALQVPAPTPNFDTVFAAGLSPTGDLSWTRIFPESTNLGAQATQTVVAISGGTVWVSTQLTPYPYDGSVVWARSASGEWTSTDYPHVGIGVMAPLQNGSLVIAGYLGLLDQAFVAPLTGCGWLDPLGTPVYSANVETLLPLGNDVLVSGWFGLGSAAATPPCGGPASIDFAARTFSAPCSGAFLARVSP